MLVFAAVQNTIKSAAFGNINLHHNIKLFKNKYNKKGRRWVFCASFLTFVHCVSSPEFCEFVTHCGIGLNENKKVAGVKTFFGAW